MEQPTAVNKLPVDDGYSNSESESEDEVIIEKWQGIIKAIEKTTSEAFAVGPPSSPLAFQTYWRNVFSRLRGSICADSGIPRHLTAPSVTKFTVTLFDATHEGNCPCCHPDVESNIVLENKDGVTKEDLMNGVIDYMYSDAFPRVYIEPCPLRLKEDSTAEDSVEGDVNASDEEFRDDSGVLVYSASWMSVRGRDGEKGAYSDEPNIVLYCCRPDEYMKRRRAQEPSPEQPGQS